MNRLELDKSSGQRIHISREGRSIELEQAFSEGFYVTKEDANAVLQLISNFLHARDEFQK